MFLSTGCKALQTEDAKVLRLADWPHHCRTLAGREPKLDQTYVCDNRGCKNIWPLHLRRRRIFEGQWACCTLCLEQIVHNQIRRAVRCGEHADVNITKVSTTVPLGLLMLAQGWITHSQMRQALQAQKTHGEGRFGDWLIRECGILPQRVALGLSIQWKCDLVVADEFLPQSTASLLPKFLTELYGWIPLRVTSSNSLQIASTSMTDSRIFQAIGRMTGLNIQPAILANDAYPLMLAKLNAFYAKDLTVYDTACLPSLPCRIAQIIEREQPYESRLVLIDQHFWLRSWHRSGNNLASSQEFYAKDGVKDHIFRISMLSN
jgi:hypothetical protein